MNMLIIVLACICFSCKLENISESANYSYQIGSVLNNPRLFSAIFIIAIISICCAISTYIAYFILKRKITLQNIELKKQYEESHNLEKKHNAIITAIPDLMFIFDKDAYFIGCIKGKENTGFLFPEEYFIGKNVLDVFKNKQLYDDTLSRVRKVFDDGSAEPLEYGFEFQPGRRYESRYVKIDENSVLCVTRDITELNRVTNELEKSLVEKDALLREIHHRVKNNMQIISSLLSLQSDIAKDDYDKSLFLESQVRISAMANVHDQLYRSNDFSSISALEYLSDLISDIEATWSNPTKNISIKLDADKTVLSLEKAVPIGLIINELLTNSYKYAFKNKNDGNISIKIHSNKDDIIKIIVSDDGVGMPLNFTKENTSKGIGYTIIDALATQINGSLEFYNLKDGGLEVRITVAAY